MMPPPATLFLGYALLGGALFLLSAGIRAFPFRELEASLPARDLRRRHHGAALAQAVGSLVLATLMLLASTIALMTAAAQLL